MSVGIEQVDNGLRKRIRNLKIFAFLYLLLTFLLLIGAIFLYNGAVIRAARDADKLAEDVVPMLGDFNDAATNPNDGTISVVGDESFIRIISDETKSGEVKIKYDKDHADKKRSDLRSIAFSGDGKVAVAAGDDGLILVSKDHGKSWSAARTDTGNDFTEIAISKKGNIAVAVGDRGLIRFSHDSGHSWSKPKEPLSKDFNGVAISDDGRTMVAVTENDEVLVSTNKGSNWECKAGKSCNASESRRDLEAVAFHGTAEKGIAIAVGDDSALMISCDEERNSWFQSESINSGADFNAVSFSGDGKTAIAVGRRGVVWVSNGLCTGQARDERFFDDIGGNNLEAVALNEDGSIAVAVGRDGTVLVSRDKGKDWDSLDTGTAKRLYGIALSKDSKNGIAVGKDSTALQLSSVHLSSTSTTLLDIDEIVEKVKGDDKLEIAKTFALTERAGTVVILLIMVHYLMGLARYNLRLAAFYQARSDTIHLNEMEALPRPGDVYELRTIMETLSPDGLDFGQSPKTAVDLAMQLVRNVRYDRKSSTRRE